MGERKVLNKYFPPDFDPQHVPRGKRTKHGGSDRMAIRMMLPFSMCCLACGHFMYQGKKFNSIMETAKGEEYLGIKRFRFYVKCEECKNQITFKTDPSTNGYEVEAGAKRNFEMWQENLKADKEKEQAKLEKEKEDSMAALERRTIESKLEIDALEQLEELKNKSERDAVLDIDTIVKKLREKDEQRLRRKNREQQTNSLQDEEDEKEIQELFQKKKRKRNHSTSATKHDASSEEGIAPVYVKRIRDKKQQEEQEDEERNQELYSATTTKTKTAPPKHSRKGFGGIGSMLRTVVEKSKAQKQKQKELKKSDQQLIKSSITPTVPKAVPNAALVDYSDSSDDE
eukprot:g3276.t1